VASTKFRMDAPNVRMQEACCMSPLWRLEYWHISGIPGKFLNSWWRPWSYIDLWMGHQYLHLCANYTAMYRYSRKLQRNFKTRNHSPPPGNPSQSVAAFVSHRSLFFGMIVGCYKWFFAPFNWSSCGQKFSSYHWRLATVCSNHLVQPNLFSLFFFAEQV
jgi:hypothetical protein